MSWSSNQASPEGAMEYRQVAQPLTERATEHDPSILRHPYGVHPFFACVSGVTPLPKVFRPVGAYRLDNLIPNPRFLCALKVSAGVFLRLRCHSRPHRNKNMRDLPLGKSRTLLTWFAMPKHRIPCLSNLLFFTTAAAPSSPCSYLWPALSSRLWKKPPSCKPRLDRCRGWHN